MFHFGTNCRWRQKYKTKYYNLDLAVLKVSDKVIILQEAKIAPA